MFDPAGPDGTDEFIEIFNLSEFEEVNLTGWKVGDSVDNDRIEDAGKGLILRPRQYAVILDGDYWESAQSYHSIIPDEALVLTIEGSTLGSGGLSNNRAETVVLFDAEDQIIFQYTYTLGNISGHSDEKIDLDKPDVPENWADSAVLNGTPGFQNSVFGRHLSVSPVLFISPNPFSPDEDGFEDEVEIAYILPINTASVNLRIYDVKGRLIRTLLGAYMSGSHGFVLWDGKDNDGRTARIGIYIVCIEGLDSREGVVVTAKSTVVLAGRL